MRSYSIIHIAATSLFVTPSPSFSFSTLALPRPRCEGHHFYQYVHAHSAAAAADADDADDDTRSVEFDGLEIEMSTSKSKSISISTSTSTSKSKSTPLNRRQFMVASSLAIAYSTHGIAHAADNSDDTSAPPPPPTASKPVLVPVERSLLKGKVTSTTQIDLPEGIDPTLSALYITARPNKADNVPRAILDGSNGKPPPILAARFANPTFPFEFDLSTLDLTQEGIGIGFSDNNQQSDDGNEKQKRFWFEGQDLIVSARFDTDGVAATRSPTDLVGRAQYTYSASQSSGDTIPTVTVPLQGRGFTGKLVTGTGKSKK